MKSFFAFLRSMRFGIILLVLVMVCSLAGSLVPQNQTPELYFHNYPKTGSLILTLKINNIFGAWYFVLLICLLCINLSLCCLTRLNYLLKMKKNIQSLALNLNNGQTIGTEARDIILSYLEKKRFRLSKTEDTMIFEKNPLGKYGSFIVHLSITLTLVFGGLVLYMSDSEDYSIKPGEKLVMHDGSSLALESFRIADETGRTDYVSVVRMESPDGSQLPPREISVNYPLTFRSYKYYQYSFGTAGSITAYNNNDGESDTFYLEERAFLSADGRNGIWFETIFPGHIIDEEGEIVPLGMSGGGVYPDPVYQVLVSDQGHREHKLALPGEKIKTGDITFEFNKPINYPGIRVKRIPHPFPSLLYISFVLMIGGFWLAFFYQPATVIIRKDSYLGIGLQASGVQQEIDEVLKSTCAPDLSR